MRIASFALLLAVSARPALAQGHPSEAAAVPVFQEPRHHLVFENALVRVLDVRMAAGDTMLYHEHTNRHIVVVIAGARTWEQFRGHERSPADSVADSAGTIFDNASAVLPYTHREANVDTVPLHYVAAQVLSPSGVTAPAMPASSGLHLDRVVDGARVYRVTLAPGQAAPRHKHAPPGLTVQVSPGALHLEGVSPERASAQSGAGAWWWRRAGAEHVLRNDGATPIQVIEIDWP